MNRDQMIDELVNLDIERFFDRDDPADYLAYLLKVGLVGYEKLSDQEIRDQYFDTFGVEL